jgi:hypothetical protein
VTNRPKAIGTAFETATGRTLVTGGIADVERLANTGAQDEGDLVVKDLGHVYVLECKATQKINLASYVDQARLEAEHYRIRRNLPVGSVTGVAVIKRRNKSIRDSYVVSTLADFFDLNG